MGLQVPSQPGRVLSMTSEHILEEIMDVGSWAEDQTQFSDKLTSNKSPSRLESPSEPDSGSEANPKYRKFSLEEEGPGTIRQPHLSTGQNCNYKIEISPHNGPPQDETCPICPSLEHSKQSHYLSSNKSVSKKENSEVTNSNMT